MRADRLLSLLMFLQNRGRTTTDRLAEELEVSRRTVIRDLYALRVAGFPVYTERGPQGGVYLHEDYRMRLTDLTQDELSALFTLNVPAPLADLGMGSEAKTALLKLAASLPVARQDVERDIRNRLFLDPNPWRASRQVTPMLTTLRQAVWEDRWVHATLLRAQMIPVEHDIAPYGLVAKGRRWYVIWQRRDGRLHIDRASDVVAAELTGETFDRSPDFDLPTYWTEWATEYEANRWFFPVRLRVLGHVLPDIERDLGRQVERMEEPELGTPWIGVEMTFDHLEHARASLLAYGGAVEVIEPDALRLSVADFGQRIADLYASRC